MILRLILFLALNFAALAIGGIFTSNGIPSDWYLGLAKAPWTPPGWVFGAAWTTIMIFFGLYLAYLWPTVENNYLFIGLYVIQWILNVGWNPTFFYFHQVFVGLVVISRLTAARRFLPLLLLARVETQICTHTPLFHLVADCDLLEWVHSFQELI